jgi:hypothetical protein
MDALKGLPNEAFYNGRWVKKEYFRVFLYNKAGEKMLADGHSEFVRLKTTGEWFETPEAAEEASKVVENDPVNDTQTSKSTKKIQTTVRRGDNARDNPNR